MTFLGTRDGLATRYAGQSGGCAELTPCVTGGRRTSSPNADTKVAVALRLVNP